MIAIILYVADILFQLAWILYQIRLFFWYGFTSHTFNVEINVPAADINPIGAISKVDLKKFIAYAHDKFEMPVLQGYVVERLVEHLGHIHASLRFLDAVPTAELEPITETYVQADEAGHSMTWVKSELTRG